MLSLRFLSLLAGGLVLVVPPMVLFDAGTGNMPAWIVAGGLFGMALISASFLYVGVAARRMRQPGLERSLGGVLLTVPMAASLVMLTTRTDPAVLWSSAALLIVSVLLFFSFVFPATLDRRQRPMREREEMPEPVPEHGHVHAHTHHRRGQHEAVVLQLRRRG